MSLGDYTAVNNNDKQYNITVFCSDGEHVILLCCNSLYALSLSVSSDDIVSVGNAVAAVVSGKKKRKKVKLFGGGVFIAFRGHKEGQSFLEFDLSFHEPDFKKESDAEVLYTGFDNTELAEFADKLCNFDGNAVSIRKIRKEQR